MINPGNVTPNYTDPSNPSSGSRTNQTWQEDTDTGGNEPQVPQRDPNAPINEGEGGGGNYGSEMPNDHNPQYGGHLTNEGLGVSKVSYQTNSSQQQQAQPSNVISSYQAQVSKLKSAGFSGQDIQNWSDNQAVKLRQAGFSQDEVDAYQGMKTPPPGQPAVYGRLPTDADFKNAASVMLGGNDHPWYEKAVDSLKNLFFDSGVKPEEAVKASQAIPTFRDIMENGKDVPQPIASALSSDKNIKIGTSEIQDTYDQAEQGGTPIDKSMGFVKQSASLWGALGVTKVDSFMDSMERSAPGMVPWISSKATQALRNGLTFSDPKDFGDWLSSQVSQSADIPVQYKNSIQGLISSGLNSTPFSRIVGAAKQGAKEGYSPEDPLGLSPEDYARLGLNEPVKNVGDFIKRLPANLLSGGAGLADLIFSRFPSAVINGGINGIVQAATEAGMSNTHAEMLSQDLNGIVQNEMARASEHGGYTGPKRAPATAEAPLAERGISEPPPPPPSAPATTLTPAYHFDSDTYGLKNEKGEFVQTGFPTEQDARTTAEQAPAPTYPPQESRLTPEVIDRYKKTISDEAEKNGIPLTPEQLQRAATVMAESHNPVVEPQKPEVTPAEPAFVTIPKKPLGLADFVRKAGGVNDEGGDVRSILGGARFRPGLVNGEGRSLDDMALAAHEAGYFNERPDTNQFLDKLSDDLHGKPQHSANDVDAANAYNDALRYNAETDRISTETGIPTEGKTHTQFWDEVARHMSRDQAAEKRTDFTQRAQDAYESWRTEALEPEEKLSKEELEHDRTQDNITKDQKSIPQGVGEPRSATEYTREGEAIGGLGGRGTEPTGGTRPAEEAGGTSAASVRTAASEGRGDAVRSNAESNRLKKLSFAELGRQSDEWQKKLDDAYDRNIAAGMKYPEADNTPDIKALYDKRIAIDTAAAQRGFEGAKKIFEDVIGNKGKDNKDATIKGTLDRVYALHDNPSGVYFMSEYTGKAIDNPKTIEELGKDITKMLFAKRNEGTTADFWLTMEHPQSGMTREGKQALIKEGIDLAQKINDKMRDFFSESENIKPAEDKVSLLYQKGRLNRGILTAVRDPQNVKLLQSVDDYLKRVLPKEYSYETTPGFIKDDQGNNAYGLTDRTRNLITLSLQSPDQFATGAHEAMHAVRYLMTPDEWKTLTDEAAKKDLRKTYDIDSRYKEDQEEETIAHWYENWQKDQASASKTSSGLFDKIAKVFKNIAAKVRAVFGNQSAEDIFSKIESGEVGQREGDTGEGQLFQKAGEKEEKPTLGDAIRGIRDTFSPTSSGDLAKRTETEIRADYGQAKRERAIAETALGEFARQANKMTPDEHMDFYNYVEGRSKGAELKNKQFQAMADTVRKVYEGYKDLIQSMPETRMKNFVTDYFTHQWADGQDEKIKDFMNTWWQQGSSRNLKERKIPTIADGLSYGLKLAEPNPVRAVSRYAGSMSNYLASVKVLRAINNDLGGGYYADGLQPQGYKPLVGRNAERIENARIDPASGKIIPARNLHLYAPAQVADLYNAFYSKGFEDSRLKPAYMLARNAINTNTLMELGLSAYHFSTITMQSLNQDMGRILRNAFAGDWQGVGNAVKGLVTPTAHFREGSQLMDQYKDLEDHGVDMERLADEFAKSNLRIGLDPLSNVSTHGGFYKAWQRGELPQVIDRLKSQMKEGYGIGALKSGAEAVSRVVQDVAHPLFSAYIPAIKMSAFHDLMGDWLRQNPSANDGEVANARVRIGDMVEDRFGEMNMENIFWNKKAKELLGLGLRAPGWDIGLVRQAGGAGYDVYRMIKDGISRNGFDSNRLDRPLFIAGAAITYVALNAALTYIKTGVPPSDQKYKDWIAYATGGLHRAFGMVPERAELPGHSRELLQMAPVPGQGPLSGVTQEASNKVATLPKKAYEAATNTDWNGKPIYDPKSRNWYQRIPGVAQAVHIASGFEPFSMEQLFDGAPEGSKLSLAERFMGVRSAGAKIVNPEGLREYNERKTH